MLLDLGSCKILHALLARESRVQPFGQFDDLPDSSPPRKHRDVSDETDIFHQVVTIPGRIQSQHFELAAELAQAENRFERCGLAGPIRADQADDSTRRYIQVDIVERDCAAVVAAKPLCANDA